MAALKSSQPLGFKDLHLVGWAVGGVGGMLGPLASSEMSGTPEALAKFPLSPPLVRL